MTLLDLINLIFHDLRKAKEKDKGQNQNIQRKHLHHAYGNLYDQLRALHATAPGTINMTFKKL